MGPWLAGGLVGMARQRLFLCQNRIRLGGWWSKRIIKFFLSVLGLLFLPLPADGAEKPVDPSREIQGYIPVQLPTFAIPTISGNGWLGRGPMTMFLVVRGEREVSRLCRYMPRIHEAITLTVDQTPVPIIGDKYQLDEVGAQLHKAINRALPEPLVIRLHLFPVVRVMGKNAEVLELPGTDESCMGLKGMPPDMALMLREKTPEAKTFLASVSKGQPESRPAPSRVSSGPPRGAVAEPSIIVKRVKAETPQKPANPRKCKKIKEVWSSGFHKISGTQYWLNKIFTLDEDNDGTVDDIGFILKAEDKADLFIHYFPGPGRQSVIIAPLLRLKDDRGVKKTCFGQDTFEKPLVVKKKPPGGFEVPDLAQEVKDKDAKADKPDLPKPVGKKSFTEGAGLVFAIVIGAGLFLVFGGGAGYALARYRRSDRRRKSRRRDKERRGDDRRQQDEPLKGEDKRKGGDRRDEEERRQKENRRGGEDRRDEKNKSGGDRRDEKDPSEE